MDTHTQVISVTPQPVATFEQFIAQSYPTPVQSPVARPAHHERSPQVERMCGDRRGWAGL